MRLATVLVCAFLSGSVYAQTDWRQGALVGLRLGTCIREGPGFNYRAHTRVPEDNWTVMVIGGPRQADGKIWYDTSRKAAGDPSGGTGWVDASQTDLCPLSQPGQPPQPPPSDTADLFRRLQSWWRSLPVVMKWTVAILALAVLITLWYRLSLGILDIILLAIGTIGIWWIGDQTRASWQPLWRQYVGGDAPDLAILLATIPALALLLRRLTIRRYG